jgi:hypothetical protein
MNISIHKLRRGDHVVALRHLDVDGANVRAGTLGVVFELYGAHEADTGPMIAWANMGACNVYNGDVELVSRLIDKARGP